MTNPQTSPTLTTTQKILPFILMLTSLGLGILANYLLRVSSWGLNIPVLMAVFVISMIGITSWKRRQANEAQTSSPSVILLLSILIFALCFVVRASAFMQALNIFVIFVCLLLLSLRMSDKDFLNFSFEDIFLGSGRSLFLLPFAPLFLFIETKWSQLRFRGKDRASALFPLLRGLIIAIPIFIVFAMLFASSDAIFGQFFETLFSWNIDIDHLISHLISIAFLSYCFAALLRNTFLAPDWHSLNEEQATAANFLQLGVLELYIILGSLIVLFTSFLIVQFKYLFGGAERVLDTTLSYAEYGRSGFFELVTVAFFLNILLLILLWLSKNNNAAKNTFKLLASTIIILLFGVILSAYKRLSLYIDAYGLTEDRFYSMAFIFFLGMLMVFFLFKLFIKKSPSLASGYIILGMLAVLNLVIINPDKQIATVNIEKSLNDMSSLDSNYLSYNLSNDAIPTVVNFHKNSSVTQATQNMDNLNTVLLNSIANPPEIKSWRSWNYGNWKAIQVLKDAPARDYGRSETAVDAIEKGAEEGVEEVRDIGESWVIPTDTRSE